MQLFAQLIEIIPVIYTTIEIYLILADSISHVNLANTVPLGNCFNSSAYHGRQQFGSGLERVGGMNKYQLAEEDLVIIGDLSKMYDVSKRTLRLYHEMELFVPYFVDDKTGYRYYSRAQLPRLDMILQMRSVGLSLNQIKKMLSTRNLSLFEALLGEQLDNLNKKLSECRMYQDSLIKQLESCKHIRNPPPLNSIFIEYIPRRTAFICDIDKYDLEVRYPEGSPWETALNRFKAALIEHGVPLTMFHQVGGMVAKEFLLQNRFICSGAFIELNDNHQYGLPQTYIDSGTYVCMYSRYIAMDNVKESEGIRMLLQYIADNEYEIAGSYYCPVIAETSIFDYNESDIFVKQQIPIKVVT